jgi:hypothetical protein
MPQALLLSLLPADLRGSPRDCTGALHRQVFEWLRGADPDLASTLHNKGHVPGAQTRELGGQFAAFTLGPCVPGGGSDYFVTTLSSADDLYPLLCTPSAASLGQTYRNG